MQKDPGFEPSLGELADSLDDEPGAAAPFLSPSLEDLLEQVAYAAQFSGGIQVVEGPFDSGKTTLAAVLQRDYLTQCAHVAALTVGDRAEDVLPNAAAELGLAAGGGASVGEAMAALRSFAQALHAESQVGIILIDDAHLLDQQTLAALASLLQTGGESVFGLHLVMWSEPGLVHRLDDLQLLDVPVHDFAVPAFSLDEFEGFIDYLRSRGAVSQSVPLSELPALWEDTEGRPGLVKQSLASSAEPASTEEAKEATGSRRMVAGLPWPHVAALSLLVMVLLWASLAREPEPEVTTRVVDLPSASGKVPTGGSGDTVSEAAATPNPHPGQGDSALSKRLHDTVVAELEPVIDERELRNAIYGSSQPERAEPLPQADADSAEAPETVPPVAQEQPVQLESVSPVQSAPKEARSAASKSEPGAQAAGPARYDSNKLLALDPESFSLQIMAATSAESLERFRAQQSNRTQLYLYRAQRDGRPWYLLLAGNYSSKAAAAAAVKTLPQAQRSGGPWPRKLDSVHQEIAEDRRN